MKYLSYLLLTFALLCQISNADMVLNKSILYFEQGEPNQQDVEIENVGTEPLYIKVEPKMVLDPGTEKQKRQSYDDPTKAGLLVSPNKLVIKPGGRKLVRFVNLNPNPIEEHVYRVGISPVVGDLVSEQSGVKIVIGYEVLVLVHAANSKPELQHKRTGKHLEIKNIGNKNILLREGLQCLDEEINEEDCEHIPGKRLYPGNEWQVELPRDMPVKFLVNSGQKNSIEILD